LDVKNLAQRIKTGVDSSEKLVYFKKSDIENLNVPDAETKKDYCNEIAKFYIKIAHVFAAIVTTINPEYTYKDSFGNTIKRSLMQKSSIPSDANASVSKINLCSERINALKGDSTSNFEEGTFEEEEKIEIHPDVCEINLDKNGETNYLNDEPGINEFIDLYFDGDYDFKTGKFMGMTTGSEKQFQEDLKRFYFTFSDNGEMPEDIKKFSDIKLKDYGKKPYCKSDKQIAPLIGSYKDELFVKYAENLRSMIHSVNEKQDELLSIINKLFVYIVDPVTKKDVIRVNPELARDDLQKIIEETREVIIELYLNCETEFAEGVKIYEAIVESQIFDTTQKHIEQLEKVRDKLTKPYKNSFT
jgi:hypothetical protein